MKVATYPKLRTCKTCGEAKPSNTEHFAPLRNSSYNLVFLEASCRPCRLKYYQERDRKNVPMKRLYERKSKLKYPEKNEARRKLQNAVRLGKVVRPSTCQNCGKDCKPAGHHSDYTKPLDVDWLCNHCHVARHFYTPKSKKSKS